ncbi:hypothetical protein Tco_0244506, partial [Tanacetum coccineum]
GLLPALEKMFPHAEHRYCVRHIYENMNQTWKGSEYKEMLWKCASSTTTVLFVKNMQELKDFNKKAYEWLKKIPSEHWSSAYFSEIIDLSSSIEAQIDGSEPGNEGSSIMPHLPPFSSVGRPCWIPL